MAKITQIKLLDDTIQADSIAYKDENTLLYLKGDSLYSYDLITKISTLVYNFDYKVWGLAYKDNYVYYSASTSNTEYAESVRSMNLDDFTIRIIVALVTGDYSRFSAYVFNGYDGEPYACVFGFYYYGGSTPSTTALRYYSNNRYRLTPTSAKQIIYATNSYNPNKTGLTWSYPFMYNIFTSSQFFAYGYTNYSAGSGTAYYKMGYVSPPNSTISLSTDTAIENIISWGYEDDENIYILSNGSLNRINKTTLVESTLLITDLGVSGSFYSYGSNGIYFLDNTNLYIIEDIEYNLTYDIKSADGSITYATFTDSAPITKALFGFDGNTVSYILTTLTGNITGQYTPEVIEGKQLIGYGVYPNSKKTSITVNRETDVDIRADFVFYEVFTRYRPLDTTFQLNIYQNTAEQNRVDKTDYLKSVGTLNGTFREPTSVTSPSITIEMDGLPTFNYIYIPNFNRYYYVTEITNIRNSVWQIDCTVDVLMSYKDAIRKCPARVERNQYEFNRFIQDDRRIVNTGSVIEDNEIENDVFMKNGTVNDYQFVMNGYKLL